MKRINLFLLLFAILAFLGGCDNNSKLNAPTISISDNVVSWKRIEGASGYYVHVGENEYETSATSFSIELDEVGSYGLYVQAYAKVDDEVVYSKKSNVLTYIVESKFDKSIEVGNVALETPKLFVDGKIVAWEIIHYATSYRIYVNGKEKDEVTANYYVVDSSEVGTVNVKVVAVSTHENYAKSEYSNEVSVTIEEQFEPVIVDVSDSPYNAVGDGVTNDRAAIQKAIDDVYNAGGGTVIISANKTFLTGNLIIKDNVTIMLEDNSMIKQSSNPEHYIEYVDGQYLQKDPYFGTNVNDDFQFNHNWYYNYPLICAVTGTKNVSVIGNGTIRLMDETSQDKVMRQAAVGFGDTKYFTISGITVENYNAYAIIAFGCEYGLFQNLTIKDFYGGCNDGISALNSSYIRITGNYIRSGDDSIDIGKISDPRGGVWCKTMISHDTPVTNIEVDNNDTHAGSEACKGLAFFVWGGSSETLEDPEARAGAEVSDVYIHDNKFYTVGIWGSGSHDSLYGGLGIVPAKHIRWYDNEIDIVQGGFYYEGISDMNHFCSMREMLNGDFEYCGLGMWSTNGNAELHEENGNHYGYISDFENYQSEIYEGLWLNSGEMYTFEADLCTSGVECEMFIRNLDTGEIISSKTFSNTSWETHSIVAKIEKDANYQLGIRSVKSDSGWAKIDNASVDTPYSDLTYYDVSLSNSYSLGYNQASSFVEGFNILPSDTNEIKPNESLTFAYFVDVESIDDINGKVLFSPLIQRSEGGWATIGSGSVEFSYSEFPLSNGKMILIFKMNTPKNFDGTIDAISPRLQFNSAIDVTVTRLMITKEDMDLSIFENYQICSPKIINDGNLAVLDEGVLFKTNVNSKVSVDNGTYEFGGYNLPPNGDDDLSGRKLKVTYYLTVEEISDLNGNMEFSPLVQRNDGAWTLMGEGQVVVEYKELKEGKIIITFSLCMIDDYDGNLDYLSPRLFINSGIKFSVDKIIIADYSAEINADNYEELIEKSITSGSLSFE